MISSDDVKIDAARQAARLLEKGLPKLEWKVVVFRDFRKDKRHINVLEGGMTTTALEWASRCQAYHGKRLVIAGDSSAVIGALAKGRSSTPGLRGICRRAVAYELACDWHLDYVRLPTGLNPADDPSRRYETS